MQEIPEWIIKVVEIEKLQCRNCKSQFNSDNLMSISIQESSKPPHKDYLCIGLYCKSCNELMIFELKEMTLIDFAFDILEQEKTDKIKKKSVKEAPSSLNKSKDKKSTRRAKNRSKITSQEVEEVKDFLKAKNLLHEDFLIALGMLPDEIKKYNYKK